MNTAIDFRKIRRFALRGLHGYKDLELDFSGKASIVVAENGSGKTTILNVLNAFLTRRFHRLSAINFSQIECWFEGVDEPLRLAKSQLTKGDIAPISRIAELSSETGISETSILEYLQNQHTPGKRDPGLDRHSVYYRLYLHSSFAEPAFGEMMDELHASLDSTLTEEARATSAQIRALMQGVEVIHLPTYRRVERALMRKPSRGRGGRADGRGMPGQPEHADMMFGLADVEQRLAGLSEDIERRSNLEYRALSARMLDELLRGAGDKTRAFTLQDLPHLDSLFRFLGRVGGKKDRAITLYQGVEQLYETGDIEKPGNWFVGYFLSRLATVIDQTKETEQMIERFVSVCNGYLTLTSDEKSIDFDAETLRVSVKNKMIDAEISLDDLSSGEKQIVSLMSTLYLDYKPKIVLIDEPELSLSIDWQRKVLPDVANSPSVEQLLAITHSPFVFDNELDGCAKPLKVRPSEGQHVSR